jgi:glucose/arabinose dehydrogenase
MRADDRCKRSVSWRLLAALLAYVALGACAGETTEPPGTGLETVPTTTTTDSVAGSAPTMSTHVDTPPVPSVRVELDMVVEGLEEPVAAVFQPGVDRMFVLERVGRVRVVDEWQLRDEPAVDLTDRVVSTESWEQGLLGIALHPNYADNGRVFLSFTEVGSRELVLAEFRADVATGQVDPASIQEVLRVPQRGVTHQGGAIRFGPDGFLWGGLGDGGSGLTLATSGPQDPDGNGQNPFRLQGSIIRIDVDQGSSHAIPPDNPFADGIDGAPEVWAFGVRNPWGLSFDGGRLFIADVGHETWEEITVLSLESDAGSNLGWAVMEGPECFGGSECDSVGFVEPFLAIPRSEGCAVVGGGVYRGSAFPDLVGNFIFADFCGRSIRSATEGGVRSLLWRYDPALHGEVPRFPAFAVDGRGEMYLLTLGGAIHRIVASTHAEPGSDSDS